MLSTICVVSKWEHCSEQNTQDRGRWERCITSEIDYEAVESVTEGGRATDGCRKSQGRECFTLLNCRQNQGSHHWKDNDWLKDRKRENQAGICRKNFPKRTASAKVLGREGGHWKMRSPSMALGQVRRSLEGLLGDLHPLLWADRKHGAVLYTIAHDLGYMMVKSHHTGSCAEIGGPCRIGEVS